MGFVSETVENKQKILIVDKKSSNFGQALKEKLKEFDSEIFFSPQLPRNISLFDYIFLVNSEVSPFTLERIQKKGVFIFIDSKKSAFEFSKLIKRKDLKNLKVISVDADRPKPSDIEKILWFTFSASSENFLHIPILSLGTKKRKFEFLTKFRPKKISKKNMAMLIVGIFLLYQLILGIFLGFSFYFFYKSGNYLLDNDLDKSESSLTYGNLTLEFGKNLYKPVRQIYLFVSAAIFPDNLIYTGEKTRAIIASSQAAFENANQIKILVFQKNKTPEEKQILLTRLDKLTSDASSIENDLMFVNQKIPKSLNRLFKIQPKINEALDFLSKSEPILPSLKNILALNTQKKYLLLFANNMELRPGGGFLGSFGTIDVSDLTIENIQIYDVYDADGQLKTHVDPPAPIRAYLNQPNWFLRDSAFSPDFFENYTQAKLFLDKEVGSNNFSGGILITTSAIQNILGAFNNIYIPDFNENINKDNFYVKAQLYAEKDFFPGSTQKKSFLGSVARQILVNIENVNTSALTKSIKKSFDEKQMVVYFDDIGVQKSLDSLLWSGKTIGPTCIAGADCIQDYIFPIDANLGVNKANFFVARNFSQKIRIGDDGSINNIFSTTIKNDSPNEVFPGGKYKNYFQLYLPSSSTVKRITKNDVLVDSFDESVGEYRTIGFLVEIPPQKTEKIEVQYELPSQLIKSGEKKTYQLVVQKQIGSKNSDFSLKIDFPNNISIGNQNFSPLVKENSITYNTNLSADKIFLLELSKK